jgi:hypothetical protein
MGFFHCSGVPALKGRATFTIVSPGLITFERLSLFPLAI